MRYLVLSLILICAAPPAGAFEIEDRARFGPARGVEALRIVSTTDIGFFEPTITSFLARYTDIAVDYVVVSSAELVRAVDTAERPFDLAISSAMDLQTKLANDGRARRYRSDATRALPEWAIWNDMLFAFSQEPAAILVSKRAFGDMPIPRDRHDLIDLLRRYPARFRGRIGTYDVRRSGLGYLFATQDSRASETYWRLTEVMGGLDARLYCCSSDMIRAVETGELLIAYNVLGSYATLREGRAANLEVVLPSDFTTVMLRTAMIPHNAPSPLLSGLFVDHLLARAPGNHAWPPIRPVVDSGRTGPPLHRIRMGPGLLVFLDQLKKRAFLSEWESAILQDRNVPARTDGPHRAR